ncbi:MAG: 16S rRNA pseudouridine(516) synthase [Hydrogenothermus sp.]|nr:MAG: 16S rRNA pseudouridine(516) synthase [Hydrogenothermus sp.]
MRLDKFLSNFGFGSRKEVKQLIKQGLVYVNDTIVKNPSLKINPEIDIVKVDNEPISYQKEFYFMLNKPSGYVSATKDETYPTVLDFFINEPVYKNLFPVGRLDIDTEGLLLITTDGIFAHRLSHPKWNVQKEYFAIVKGDISTVNLKKFEDTGIFLKKDKYQTKPFKIEIVKVEKDISEIKITVKEGKYHIVKKIMEQIGFPVLYLKRERIGNLKLDDNLKTGEYRHLTEEEIKKLKSLVNL